MPPFVFHVGGKGGAVKLIFTVHGDSPGISGFREERERDATSSLLLEGIRNPEKSSWLVRGEGMQQPEGGKKKKIRQLLEWNMEKDLFV